jgi:predicted esterase
MSKEHHLALQRTLRYYTMGDPDQADTIIYVLHGYAQLARYFIEKFKGLDKRYYVVAPEGMHRFYVNGGSGRVGASWMTKEDRERDIEDTVNGLNELSKLMGQELGNKREIVLGFSQGGAAAARWYYTGTQIIDHLIIWASVFPPDLPREKLIQKAPDKTNHFVIGNEDEYYSLEEQMELIAFYSDKGFETTHYNGNHSIQTETLQQILRRLR